MSDHPLERTDFDTNDTGLRDHIESSVANHSLGPDIDSAVGGALEEHSRQIKTRNDREQKGELPPDGIRRTDRLRHSIRQAVNSAKAKAAAPLEGPKASFEIESGPPKTWDKTAQADWPNLSHAAKQAILRTDRETFNALEPHFRRYRELDTAIAPHRHVIPQGMSEPQAIGNVLAWAGELRGPNKHAAFAQLANECGVSPPDLIAYWQQQYQQQPQYEQQYQQQYQQPDYAAMQREQQVHQVLSQFSQGKPHFEKVRYAMGLAIQDHGQRYMRADGNVDLDKVYGDCCRAAGLSDGHDRSRRTAAAVSGRGRAPVGSSHDSERQSGGGVRAHVKAAISEVRDRA